MNKLYIFIATLFLVTFIFLNNADANRGGRSRGDEYRIKRAERPRRAERRGRGNIEHVTRIRLGARPRGGWRGQVRFWEGHDHYIWSFGPRAPWYAWEPYFGWRLGLWYYSEEGFKCFVTSTAVPGEWSNKDEYCSSEDAVYSALDYCRNNASILYAKAEDSCIIRECVRW